MRKLLRKIEMLRQEMHEVALIKGISHPDVLRVSQMLDLAINEFYNSERLKKAG